MKTYARLTNCGVPPLKMRRYAGTIKGEKVSRAVAILDMQPSPACQTLGKLLRSAIANAQNNNGLDPENLIVSNVMVDQGPTMKRIRPRARGRAYRILKRSSHITIELDLKSRIGLEKTPVAGVQKGKSRQAKNESAAKGEE